MKLIDVSNSEKNHANRHSIPGKGGEMQLNIVTRDTHVAGVGASEGSISKALRKNRDARSKNCSAAAALVTCKTGIANLNIIQFPADLPRGLVHFVSYDACNKTHKRTRTR
jgi:hypothetical protein